MSVSHLMLFEAAEEKSLPSIRGLICMDDNPIN